MFIVPKNSAHGKVPEEGPTQSVTIESPVLMGVQIQPSIAAVREPGAGTQRAMEVREGDREETPGAERSNVSQSMARSSAGNKGVMLRKCQVLRLAYWMERARICSLQGAL